MKNQSHFKYGLLLLLVLATVCVKATTSYSKSAGSTSYMLDSNRAPIITGTVDVPKACPNENWSETIGIMDPDGDDFEVSVFSSNPQVVSNVSLTTRTQAYPENYSLNFTIGTSSGTAMIYISVTDSRGQSTTKIVRISLKATRAYIVAQTNLNCYGDDNGSATAMADNGYGGYTYSWNTTPAQTTPTISNLSGGTYVCTVRDNENCIVNTTVTIEEPSQISLTFSSRNLSCKGDGTGSATVTATGGVGNYSYLWNTNPAQYTATINNVAAGTYTCSVRDLNDCQAEGNVTITEPSMGITASLLNQTPTKCSKDQSGTATVMATGGSGMISYSWNTSPVQTNQTAVNLGAKEYICKVSDQSACTVEVKVNIRANFNFKTKLANLTHERCKGDSNGTATVQVTQGSGNYLYSWNTEPQQTTATATNLPPGTYICTIIDRSNACTEEDTAVITGSSTLLEASIVRVEQPLCADNGEIEAKGKGGDAPYTYNWQVGGVTSPTISSIGPGIYECVITDARGCSKSTDEVELIFVLEAKNETRSIAICEGEVYSVGTNNYTEQGTYTDTLRTSGGCDSLVLTSLLAVTTIDNTVTITSSDLIANEMDGKTYQWIDCATQLPIVNATSKTFLPQQSGSYAVLIQKDDCGLQSICYPYTKTGSTAIDEKTTMEALRVYPNPSTGIITMGSTSTQGYLITNYLGQIVTQIELKRNTPEQLDLSHLPDGLYYLSATGNTTNRQKLVIMK